MCGIVGYLDKSGASTRLGPLLLGMLGALDRRGPDSAGVAVWGAPADGMIVRIALRDTSVTRARASAIVKRAQAVGRVSKVTTQGPYVRFELAKGDPRDLARALEVDRDVEI